MIRLVGSIHSEQHGFQPTHLVLFGEQKARVDAAEPSVDHEGIVAVEEAGCLGKAGWIIFDCK